MDPLSTNTLTEETERTARLRRSYRNSTAVCDGICFPTWNVFALRVKCCQCETEVGRECRCYARRGLTASR